MRMDVLWLAVFAALHAGAGAAQACGCGRPTASVAQQLCSAQEDAVAIYRARVPTTGPGEVAGTASAEVLDVSGTRRILLGVG